MSEQRRKRGQELGNVRKENKVKRIKICQTYLGEGWWGWDQTRPSREQGGNATMQGETRP